MVQALVGTGPQAFQKDTTIGGLKLGCLSDEIVLNADGALSASQIGSLIVGVPTASFTTTLPPANSVPRGAQIPLYCSSAGGVWTIQRQGSDIIEGVQNLLPYFQMAVGDSAVLESNGTGTWRVVGGSASLRTSGDFRYNLAANGWQKLPSGLIVQWGVVAGANLGNTLTFPLAFPNNCFSMTASGISTTPTTNSARIISKTSFQIFNGSADTTQWMAVGN